jgi:hypothetical protein
MKQLQQHLKLAQQLYRFYNGTVTPQLFVETIAPATPVVTEQWTAY